jgi:hypothetical protein
MSIGTPRALYELITNWDGRQMACKVARYRIPERNMMVDLILLAMVIASAFSLCVVSPKMDTTTTLPSLTEETVMESPDTADGEIADEAA